MSRKTVSIKGVEVDFDLFEVKRQIAKKAPSDEAKKREDFVYSKRRRGSKRTVEKMLKDQRESTVKAKTAMDAQTSTEPQTTKPPKTLPKRRIIKKNKN